MKKAVIISCFDWYRIRLEPIRDYLVKQGYKVTVFESDFSHINKTVISNRYSECTYIHVPPYKRNISLKRIFSHLIFGNKIKQVLKKESPDLIYCLIPPNNVGWYCKKYKERHANTLLFLDIIDLWPESMPLERFKNTLPLLIWKKMRNETIKNADFVFTECDLYREKLKGVLDNNKTKSLYLYKEQSTDQKERIKEYLYQRKIDNKKIKFAYLGSMNNIIDIEGISTIIKKYISDGYICELYAIGDGERKEEFEDSLRSIGCTTFFYGTIFDENEKARILAPCNYAFNMMKKDVNVGLTMKSIDYLSYGLPLINNIKGDTWNIIEENGIGQNVLNEYEVMEEIDPRVVLRVFEEKFTKNSFIMTFSDAFSNLKNKKF